MLQLILVLLLGPLVILECENQLTASARTVMPRPVRRLVDSPSLVKEIDLFEFEFQRPYFGFEGPNFTRLDGEPSAG
ncbi:MAG: hypothetical protein ABR501_05430, partial [Pyrinomonadaceae bacterium]